MALGAVLAAALTTGATRYWGMYLDGLDVSSEPATPRRYGVQADSVDLFVAGPGGVSTLDFVISDPLRLITVQDGMAVRFQYLGTQLPYFQGWVDHWSNIAAYGNVGRAVAVSAVGAETIMDWSVTSVDLTLASGLEIATAVQAAAAICINTGPLRPISGPLAFGTQAQPVGSSPSWVLGSAVTITAGTSLREAIAAILAGAQEILGTIPGGLATVDSTFGLRLWQDVAALTGPDGDPAIGVNAEAPPTAELRPSNLAYETAATELVRAVIVRGTGVTSTQTDGTGKPGRTAVLVDATITTAAAAATAGKAYLGQYRLAVRGSFDIEAQSDAVLVPSAVAPRVVLTSTAVGSGTFRLMGMRWRWHQANPLLVRDVHIDFGGQAPSGAAVMRRLTRNQLS